MSIVEEGIPVEPETEDTPVKITFTKPELLERISDAFQEYRKLRKLPYYQSFKIHPSILTYKIIFDSFELKKGFSKHPSWSNISTRINYTLKEFAEKEDNEFYITQEIEREIDIFIKGSNCKTSPESPEVPGENYDLLINYDEYFKEEQITVFICTICKSQLQKYEIKPHLKKHTLKEIIEEQEES